MSGSTLPTPPPQLHVIDSGDGIVIRRRWFGTKVVVFGLVGLFLLVLGVVDLIDPIGGGSFENHGPWWIRRLAVGFALLALLYVMIAGCINKTDIMISPNWISVHSYPMWWLGDQRFSTFGLKDFQARRRVIRGKNGNRQLFEVNYVGFDGKTRSFVRGLDSIQQANYIVHVIEYLLALDEPSQAEPLPKK